MDNTQQTSRTIIPIRTNRGLAKFFFLSLLTFGIYGLVMHCHIADDINRIAGKHDGQHTIPYFIVFLLQFVGIGFILRIYWFCTLSGRVGNELISRNIPYRHGTGTYWGWKFFGALLIVGPFIYYYKLLKAFNMLAEDYNSRGE
jgi:hypothetical protein